MEHKWDTTVIKMSLVQTVWLPVFFFLVNFKIHMYNDNIEN